jgi:uncharacterized Zn finger protein
VATKQDTSNVNVTLGLSGSSGEKLLGKEFPCPLCGASMPIRLTRKQKPYCHCLSCMLQLFFRGKIAIHRLEKMIESGILISGDNSSPDMAITLYNRVRLLKTQKLQLEEKRSLFFSDDDLESTISFIQNEIQRLQNNLQNIAQSIPREKQ